MKVFTETTLCEEVSGHELCPGDCIVEFKLGTIFFIKYEEETLVAKSPHVSGGSMTLRINPSDTYHKAIKSNSSYFAGGDYIKKFN